MKKTLSLLLCVSILLSCAFTAVNAVYEKNEDSKSVYKEEFMKIYDYEKYFFHYVYDELYYFKNTDNEIEWVLIYADVGVNQPAETSVEIGNRIIKQGCILYPFETGYGVYDVNERRFYDIKDYQNVPGRVYELIYALKELNIGEEVNTEPPITTPVVTEPSATSPTQQSPSKSSVTSKKDNPIKVSTKTKSIKVKNVKKKKQVAKPLTIKKAKGKVTVTKIKNGTNAKIYNKITVNNKTGAITFKKGKYAKKTYKIKLKITAAGNADYNAKTVTKVVKIKVK